MSRHIPKIFNLLFGKLLCYLVRVTRSSQLIVIPYPEKSTMGLISLPSAVNDYEVKIRRWE